MPIRFIAADTLAVDDYEKHIYKTGEVSTRKSNWHDLFNALVWCRFPKLKAAMNAMHFSELGSGGAGRRGKVRDALTLFDESGVIVCGTEPGLLDALANKDWSTAFVGYRDRWERTVSVTVCGHAILEKFLDPYKAVTAHALLLSAPRKLSIEELDCLLSEEFLAGKILESTSSLSPLPLMGIPGWWPPGEQGEAFYRDTRVFRPDSGRRAPARVHQPAID